MSEMIDPEAIETIFLDAVELPPDQLHAFLDQRCGSDLQLRAAVEQLIAADRQAGEGKFLRSGLFASEDASQSSGDDLERPALDERDRFRIIGPYRQGGLGEVFLAHDRQLDRDVAVKQIRPQWQGSVEARHRFIQEAKVTGKLEHPGIVPVYAMGTWPDGKHFYAMRFIEGDTMNDAIQRYHQPGPNTDSDEVKRLQLRELLSRFVDVCNTIQYAHSKQVLHRDIKPSNIMVGPYGETLVVDWGLAKLLDEPETESMTADWARALGNDDGSTPTQVGGRIGTPQYMSPEQAGGKLDEIGTRTDVYLLGATLYQILTGQAPHHEDSIARLLKRIGDGILVRPREISPGIAAPLESICLKAMATRPSDRYSDSNQIAEDVNRWMADEPVSVHKDNVSIQLNRWMRRHRAATSTLAVSILLLAIGGVLGSILWNVANVRKLQAEEERRSKKLELEAKDQQRLVELETAARAAENLAEIEISRDRFSSALNVLRNTLAGIESEVRMSEQADRIRNKAERIGALVDFYKLADTVEQQNVLSRDTKAMMAATAALKRLGIWDHPDWWTALPDQDLSPQQSDRLRWDIYQQLMLMDAMAVKIMANRLASKGGWGRLMNFAFNSATTTLGTPEAQAALILSDRIDRFRLSESTRLYRSFARLRFDAQTRHLQGQDLGPTLNGADAHSLAVLCQIASLDPGFKEIFGNYNGDDPLLAARELFGRSAALRPTYYGAHLGLGQIEYLIAKRKADLRWEDLEPSLRAFSQCITLVPDRCFAYADRSSIYRNQALLIAKDDRYGSDERNHRVAERLQWSLADAERAMEFYNEHPWVGWQVGQSYWELRQFDRALDLWIRTALDVCALGKLADSTFIGVDDARGRGEIGDLLDQLLRSPSPEIAFDLTKANIALAGVRLNQTRPDEALDRIETALSLDPDHQDARAIRGMILLRERASETAKNDFQTVFDSDPNHPLASFGLAQCMEDQGQFADASRMFELAERVALTSENQAAAALGQCRNHALLGQRIAAERAARRAMEIEPACDLLSTVYALTRELIGWKKSAQDSQQRIAALEQLLASLSKLPRATNLEAMPKADPKQLTFASILNGDFELGSMRYWNAPSGAKWETNARLDSSAQVDTEAHSGTHSLRIIAKADHPTTRTATSQTDSADDAFGRTGQTFSVVAGQPYQLACWVKAKDLSRAAMRVLGPRGQTLIEFDSGSYPWRRITAPLLVDEDPRGSPIAAGSIVPCQIQILATGTGTLWLDDISCQSVAAVPR